MADFYQRPTVSSRGNNPTSTESVTTTETSIAPAIDKTYKGFIDEGLTNYYNARQTSLNSRSGSSPRELDSDGFPVGTSASSKANTIAHEKDLAAAKATIQAVNTSLGSAKVTAINARLTFIKKRVNQLIQESGQTSVSSTWDDQEFQTYMTAWKAASTLIPGGIILASIATLFTSVMSADEKKQIIARKTAFYTTALDGYTKDVQQLNSLKESLNLGTVNQAPTSSTTVYWIAGIGFLFLLFLYLKKRKRRKKR
ncbi:hypothetical protein [Spirosoma linguale]|uniref:Uncharacterized protein n=1 Tax=Spirosoma linguale (strain ATCC 33905 / DSM 74 / LMG 10896 / Claus 1) TaxID=504472 RepID=D2QGY8_SPILD|nr:hypothetical protein Slin_0691 [Spirosoma linguale DSM 74]